MLLEILVIVAGADFGCSDDINKKGIEHEWNAKNFGVRVTLEGLIIYH